MIRINVFVEGQTEETFVRDVLAPHYARLAIFMNPIMNRGQWNQAGMNVLRSAIFIR